MSHHGERRFVVGSEDARANSEDAIVVAHSLIYFPFKYYNQTSIRPRLYAPAAIPVYAGGSMLERQELTADLPTVSARRVWFLWTDGFYQHQPTVPQRWHLEVSRRFDDTAGFKGAIYVDEYEIE